MHAATLASLKMLGQAARQSNRCLAPKNLCRTVKVVLRKTFERSDRDARFNNAGVGLYPCLLRTRGERRCAAPAENWHEHRRRQGASMRARAKGRQTV